MKVAMFIDKGISQFVLTPESDFEKHVVSEIENNRLRNLQVFRGAFYECRGGWVRQGSGDDSLILRFGVE